MRFPSYKDVVIDRMQAMDRAQDRMAVSVRQARHIMEALKDHPECYRIAAEVLEHRGFLPDAVEVVLRQDREQAEERKRKKREAYIAKLSAEIGDPPAQIEETDR